MASPLLRWLVSLGLPVACANVAGVSFRRSALADRFVRENDVVLVGINHRLGLFGYSYLGAFDEKYADSGNVGQLDIVAALGWVRRNISRFGGNPDSVTVSGESGANPSALLAMPSAKGWFTGRVFRADPPSILDWRRRPDLNGGWRFCRLSGKGYVVDAFWSLPDPRFVRCLGGS